MIEIPKSELIPLMVAHYSKLLQDSAYHLYIFQQKHKCTFEEFEKLINTQSEESFEDWDDYISWKGHLKSADFLSDRIQKIGDGLFNVA